jgi:hypothetical protein
MKEKEELDDLAFDYDDEDDDTEWYHIWKKYWWEIVFEMVHGK